MRRGTTPTHTFTLPFSVDFIDKLRVVYAQRNIIKVVKKETDVTLRGNEVVVKLTQQDTLKLNCKLTTDIQLRVLTTSGDALASDIYTRSTKRCLDDEVLC